MFTTILQHDVQDFATWKVGFEAHKSARTAAGALRHTVGALAGQPNTAVIVIDWSDKESFEKFMQDPSLAEAMKAGGVVGAPTVQWVEGTTHDHY